MTDLLTAGQMRALEASAMAAGAVTGLQLMERAGRGAVAVMFGEWPDLADGTRHAVVLCGPGNNGGDGYVVARRLRDRGWRVEVFGTGDPAAASADARRLRELWGGPVGGLEAAGQGERPDLLVDALFGTGLTRAIPRPAAEASAAVRARTGAGALRVLALDCVSGLDCDSGRLLLPEGVAREDIEADLTVTFHAAKRGHYLGAPVTRAVRVVDIGLGRTAGEGAALPEPGLLRLVGPDGRPGWLAARLPIAPGRHKYDRGHVLVLGGGPGKGGAARLAARSALRIGAGLVTVAVPPAALQENAARLDAIMLRPLRDGAALSEMLQDERLSALVLGPGLGVGAGTRALVRAALAAERGTVLDADALTSFAEEPGALFAALHGRCVLTPHEGEFARLFPDLGAAARDGSKVDAAAEAAARSGAVILLKGPDTVIASPSGAVSLNAALYERAAPWLGTAGAGDVLAGMIGGLMASGRLAAHLAAETAAWLHVEAARRFGPGLIAEDLPEALPCVLRADAL
ncbi:NAD(P)H-hydrate dehydratase [Histidinibacterium lentulum]|uniref:Bifunctional NAD(P)H-hydrate repair enzyme n=1 Tax=Histidinibacterium lentulum TaxID=2480588 RepID=A0A3N2R4P3_9RHOB|nr:NAD(P)H-hydrate dehydratase [Histidinibacterium lentulum]ROU02377.1 NAD(P)H-hydrate dehydratase [Histidinibacterium lentulum]